MKTMKKAMSVLLALVMLIAMLPTGVFAAYKDEFSDFPTGWSKVAMEAAVDNGLLNGFTDGTIKPGANLTRAEMAAIITRAFNAKTKADISAFTDVAPNAWYYDYIAKAVKMGALNGKSSTMMYPDTPITREEVFTAVARVLVLSSENTSALNRYNDKGNISSWAVKSMSALAERGYVNGDDLGNAKPKANITREEFAQFMYNTIRTYITKEGTYTKDLEGITVLRVGNVILEGLKNTSDLVLGDGVGEDPVRITNVKIEKRLLTRGGRITLQNTTVGECVVVNNVNGITYFNNYRNEKVFDGIIENTEARFKERQSGGGTVAPATRYDVIFMVDGVEYKKVTVKEGAAIGADMPLDPTKPGYTFPGWKDEHGNPVTAETIVNGDMTVTTNLTPNTYNIVYEFEDGAGFVTGYIAPTTYGPDDTTDILPKPENVSPATGRHFLYWIDKATSEQPTSLPLYDTNGATLTLVAKFDNVPPTYYTVRFFEGYPQDEDYLLGEVGNIVAGTYVADGDIPAIDEYNYRTGHKKNSSIASVYATEYEHKIRPTYWYVDDTNKLVPFTSDVKIVKNTDVYLLYKNYTTFMSIDGQVFSVTAQYEHSTRLLNSMKDMAWGARSQLELALNLDVVSGLDEKALDKLVAANILDSDKNIQKLNLPIAIGKVVKRETINGSIKQFIRDTINNDAKLDSILDMIDIDEFIDEIDIDQMIKDMDEDELADLIKSDKYKDKVINFVLEDLKKTDSKLFDAVVDHIMTDEYKDDLIDEIIGKLKNGTAEDTIINAIKDSDKIFDMVIEALKKEDATLMPSAVSHIKTTLAANTTDGASLRKTVLMSTKLKDILTDEAVKTKLLGMLTDKEFVNKAMQNHDFRVEMVEAIVENDHFLEKLVETDIFTKYVVDNLHRGELKDDITSLLTSPSTEATKFRNKIIEEIKKNDTFLNLIKEGGALRNDIIKFSDFVTDEDNFVKYVFGQLSGQALADAQSKYSFITQDQIDDILEEKYPEILWLGSLTDRQDFLDDIYNDDAKRAEAKATIITEAQKEFDKYAEDILDKLENKEEIEGTNVNNVINDLLVDHTTKYINEDHSLNHDEEMAIEYVLVHYIGDVLTGKSNIGVDADMTDHIDTLITNLLSSDDADDKAKVIAVVDEYIGDYNSEAQAILGDETTYAKVVEKLVTLVQLDGSAIYADVDNMLKANIGSVSDDPIAKFIKDNADSNDLKSSIQSYIAGMDNSEIAGYIKSFMNDGTIAAGNTATNGDINTAKVREEIVSYLTADKIREYAEDFIEDPANADELKTEVTKFVENIDGTFVNSNRATIEEALAGMDLSGIVDQNAVKDYINSLSDAEKQNFADMIYNKLIETPNVKTFIDSLLNEKTFAVTESNLSIIKAIAEALRSFDYEDVIAEINNATIDKLIDVVGEDFIKEQFNTIIDDYCDGLVEVIEQVESDKDTREYTTSLTVVIDIINDIYKPLYEKAQSKVEERIQNVYGLDLSQNPYIEFLVTDNLTSRLFNKTVETDVSTGYAIKDVLDYYDYLYMLLLVADDAACWFGENVSDAKIDAIYEAMIGKMLSAHGKLNEIIETYLEEDELPAQAESILKSVQQLNDAFMKIEPTLKKIFDKYLTSGINNTLEDGIVPGEEKGDKLIDFIIGQEEPVVNIDTIYNVFYYYDDSIQDKLAEIVQSDKFKAAVEKFESSSIGQKFLGNGKIQGAYDSVYDLFVDIAKDGIDRFRIEKDVITTEDAYRVKVGGVEIIIKRFYE